MNSFALIAFITVATDFSLAALSIARARTLKTLRHSLTALAAFAIASSFVAASFAGEFTVYQGKRYRATLALGSVERLVDNAQIAQKFLAFVFRQHALLGVWSEAPGRRRLARKGDQRQPAAADRCRCQIVSTAASTSRRRRPNKG